MSGSRSSSRIPAVLVVIPILMAGSTRNWPTGRASPTRSTTPIPAGRPTSSSRTASKLAMEGPRIDDSEVLAAAEEELADEATVGLAEAVAAAVVATEEVTGAEVRTIRAKGGPGPS